ncbi:cation:proton antiporter domain-containing protein [Cypionkella sinensis]|uniref:Cation:proton antiporter n=1 Tax=Cypionkella sinensis TaxID=1756043 RepID=A0ABV7J461_9RHOB
MTDFLLLAFVFLVAGVLTVPIAARLGLGSVLGYLIAGIVISPVLALLHVDVASIQHFAEFGVVMMLFLVGLELEPETLWAMRARLLGLGGGQVVLTTLAVMAVAMALGQVWSVALAVGLVFSLSSTAIVLQTLGEKGLMKSDAGQASFAVLLTQDIAVIPMLALIPLLALPELQGGHSVTDHAEAFTLVAGLNGWQVALVNIAAIIGVVLGGSYLTRPVFRFVASAQLHELFTATALMMVIGIALLMTLVGLSPALGTFLAGVVLANSEYRHELESDIDPFKALLLGLFFMTVGAGINFVLLWDNLGQIIALTLGLIVVKVVVLLVLGRIFRLGSLDKWLFGLGLAQAGEFGFVLISLMVSSAVLPGEIADKLLLVVALSMLLTPGLFIFYDRMIAPRLADKIDRPADEITDPSHIIIAGHGRVGGLVNRMLRAAGYHTTVIDFSSKQLDMLAKFGVKAYFGDATRPDMLISAGIAEAKLFVIAIDDKDQITELVRHTTQTYPNLHVIARAVDRNHVYDLWAAGCRDIIRETYDSSTRMGRSAFQALGATLEQAEEMRQAYNVMDQKSMLAMAEHYDPNIPNFENEAYIKNARAISAKLEQKLILKFAEILGKTPIETLLPPGVPEPHQPPLEDVPEEFATETIRG